MTGISNRHPDVYVSYVCPACSGTESNSKGHECRACNGVSQRPNNIPIGRVFKHFEDPYAARRFYVGQRGKGLDPRVHKVIIHKDTVPTRSKIMSTDLQEAREVEEVREGNAPSKKVRKPRSNKTQRKGAKPVATKTKTKGGKKKVAKAKVKKGKASSPASSRNGRPASPEREKIMVQVLKRLAKLSGNSDGMTRGELREELGVKNLGTPTLERLGLVECGEVEDKVGICCKITLSGRKAAKANKLPS